MRHFVSRMIRRLENFSCLLSLFSLLLVCQLGADEETPLQLTSVRSASGEIFENAAKVSVFQITPPASWIVLDPKVLPKTVSMMTVGKTLTTFPPSINVSSEPYRGTLKDYLQMVKKKEEEQGKKWQDLGSIKTEAGSANLSQVDYETNWGIVRSMHVILVKDEQVAVVTVAALKSEFSQFYPTFFTSMRSLKMIQK